MPTAENTATGTGLKAWQGLRPAEKPVPASRWLLQLHWAVFVHTIRTGVHLMYT